MLDLNISSTIIRRDEDGILFSLNDLHKASGGLNKHRPSLFMANSQTQDLINEINLSSNSCLAVKTQKGGSNPGTYACKEIVYAYAMWISPKFHLQVIQAYDKMVQDSTDDRPMPSDPMVRAAEAIPSLVKAFEALGVKGNRAYIAADQTARKHTGVSLLEDSGNLHLEAETTDRILTPTAIGKIIGDKSGAGVNIILEEMGFQDKIDGQWRAKGDGEKHAVVMDTGKKKGGIPVTQMKWKESVIPFIENFTP